MSHFFVHISYHTSTVSGCSQSTKGIFLELQYDITSNILHKVQYTWQPPCFLPKLKKK